MIDCCLTASDQFFSAIFYDQKLVY